MMYRKITPVGSKIHTINITTVYEPKVEIFNPYPANVDNRVS
jgi:hypothetical protein